ncbi:MAG: sodium ion-translocating decarboxylase subunit beta [Candidatus Cloacimonetes bacterium]|nr:sodium ion-translocating decarboxylase subunit beta [Candidatus Cloacimonadota bacterium]
MDAITQGITHLSWDQAVMMIIGAVLIYLAIARKYEPTLLLPIGFGTILVNIPFSAAIGEHGALSILFDVGIRTELFPLLIFIAIGAMIDFTPLLKNPSLLLFGAAAQLGIFVTMVLATALGFSLKEAGAIGIIGAADGPTSIYVANRFAPSLLGPISVAAYSYMALVPIIQPPIIRMLTTREERRIRMEYQGKDVPKIVKIVFPVALTLIAGVFVPASVSLIGFLMFGNLLRESGVVESLSRSAQNELGNIVTILLGIAISSTMSGADFMRPQTLFIMLLGLVAFVFDTVGGVLFAKLINLFRRVKLNPMIGACGISAFPMSARVVHKMGQEEDKFNLTLLMPAVSVNVGGQIASVIAGGILLALLA